MRTEDAMANTHSTIPASRHSSGHVGVVFNRTQCIDYSVLYISVQIRRHVQFIPQQSVIKPKSIKNKPITKKLLQASPYAVFVYTVEMCMGMGFSMGTGIPWKSHGNGNKTQNWEWEWDGREWKTTSVGMGITCTPMGIYSQRFYAAMS